MSALRSNLILFLLVNFLLASQATPPSSIILVPTSHLDAGWVLPYSTYYNMKVKPSFDSMARFFRAFEREGREVEARFTISDLSFLSKWLERGTNDFVRDILRLYAENGWIELAHGGWV